MYMILFVLHDAEKLEPVLDAWEQAGVSGVTILTSVGMASAKEAWGLREDIPLIPRLEDFLDRVETTNRTFFTIIDQDDALVERILKATEDIVGDLDMPQTGIMAVLPVARVKGLHRIPGTGR